MSTLRIEPVFWDFSLRIYNQDGMPAACLWLQDERGVDVNLLLFCVWFGATRGSLDEEALAAAMRFSTAWGDAVVKPLRAARRWLKRSAAELAEVQMGRLDTMREQIKACELAAEQTQENALQNIARNYAVSVLAAADARAAATANIQRYLEAAGILADAASDSRIRRVLDGVFATGQPETGS